VDGDGGCGSGVIAKPKRKRGEVRRWDGGAIRTAWDEGRSLNAGVGERSVMDRTRQRGPGER